MRNQNTTCMSRSINDGTVISNGAMQIRSLRISEVKVVTPCIFTDDRGFFTETFNTAAFRSCGFNETFVQDNHAMSRDAGVIRGLHFQIGHHKQGKLIRVVRGAVLDIAVDIRTGSPSFGQHVSRVLSAENWEQLWVPVGFAHGYCTLKPDTEVIYKVTAFYDPASERGIQFDDSALAIDWPFSRSTAQLSPKDLEYRPLREQPVHFQFEERIVK